VELASSNYIFQRLDVARYNFNHLWPILPSPKLTLSRYRLLSMYSYGRYRWCCPIDIRFMHNIMIDNDDYDYDIISMIFMEVRF
jgi:hypothetical protein